MSTILPLVTLLLQLQVCAIDKEMLTSILLLCRSLTASSCQKAYYSSWLKDWKENTNPSQYKTYVFYVTKLRMNKHCLKVFQSLTLHTSNAPFFTLGSYSVQLTPKGFKQVAQDDSSSRTSTPNKPDQLWRLGDTVGKYISRFIYNLYCCLF